MEGRWLSVLEFAAHKKKSISTVRRYIKANRVKFKEDSGKYFIFVKNYKDNQLSNEKEILALKLDPTRLQKEIILLKEEMSEAKMLISVYENTTIESLIPQIKSVSL